MIVISENDTLQSSLIPGEKTELRMQSFIVNITSLQSLFIFKTSKAAVIERPFLSGNF